LTGLMIPIARIVDIILEIYLWIIVVRAILSWVRPNPFNPVVRFIYALVDPISFRIAKIIPTRIGMVDIAPLILIIMVMVLQKFLVEMLYRIGMG